MPSREPESPPLSSAVASQDPRPFDKLESDAEFVESLRPQPTIDGERLIAVFSRMVEPLGWSLPSSSEVVLHDLSKLPNSIVAIHGDVTGRRVGDPATDLLLEQVAQGAEQDAVVGYESVLPDGRRLRCSTILIRDVSGTAVAALCINTDTSVWEAVSRIARDMLGHSDPSEGYQPLPAAAAGHTSNEVFARNVEELAAHLIYESTSRIGKPVEEMKKGDKVEVVAELHERGFFMLRDSVDMVAEVLSVSRFTVYNYLNESGAVPRAARSGRMAESSTS